MTPMMKARLVATGTAMFLLAGGLTAVSALPAAAATCASGVPGDVNGDGHAEVAVSESGVAGLRGGVHVFYGKSSGLVAKASGRARDDQYFDQDTTGVPGRSEDSDNFGRATAFGDFNDDGCADLALGVPGENDRVGSVTILYGSRSGLTTTGVEVLGAGSFPSGPGTDARGIGSDLVVADLDDDGVDDLAAAAVLTPVDGAADAGAVLVFYGTASGLGGGSRQPDVLTRATPGVPGSPAVEDFFGAPLAAGDFDGNGVSELAVGLSSGTGGVQTLQRDSGGYGDPQPAVIATRASALAAGDLNADGRDDLAVGDPDEGCLECDEEYGYGSVTVFSGSADGLAGPGTKWTQDSSGVAGTAVPDDGFGYSLAIGPFDGDATDDLAVGTPSDERYVGSVTLLLGSTGGLTTDGAGGALYDQATPGIAGSQGPNRFGASLGAAFVQSGDQASLVIGVPSDDIGRYRGTGRIVQLSIQPSGPKASTSRTLHLDSPGVKGKPAKYTSFGVEVS